MNPDYIKLAQIAYDTVLQTMIEGETTHPANEWQDISTADHAEHIKMHIGKHRRDKTEDHIAHALTRLAMIKYLESKP
ncbi:MAG: hypothetical protein WC365_10165 [Candidatus Babeliales bacterium]|jgi:hypothetical protein